MDYVFNSTNLFFFFFEAKKKNKRKHPETSHLSASTQLYLLKNRAMPTYPSNSNKVQASCVYACVFCTVYYARRTFQPALEPSPAANRSLSVWVQTLVLMVTHTLGKVYLESSCVGPTDCQSWAGKTLRNVSLGRERRLIRFQNTDTPTARSVHLEIKAYHRASVETLGRPEFVGRCRSCLLVPDSPRCWFCRDAHALKQQNKMSKKWVMREGQEHDLHTDTIGLVICVWLQPVFWYKLSGYSSHPAIRRSARADRKVNSWGQV